MKAVEGLAKECFLESYLGEQLYRTLLLPRQSAARTKGLSYDKRIKNILWVKELDRSGLTYGSEERQIQVYETARHEKLYIQYPGKETVREGAAYRPWDFHPVIINAKGVTAKDMSFYDIWDDMFNSLEEISRKKPEPIRLLARLFYGMAFMTEHTHWLAENTIARRVTLGDSGYELKHEEEVRVKQLSPGEIMIYEPPQDVIQVLAEDIPSIGDISVEGFLLYNDLLAWNEDCKYFYRDNDMNKGEWSYNAGRVNNLLTHISVIGLLLGDIRLSKLLSKFSKPPAGVAPASWDEIVIICGGLVSEAEMSLGSQNRPATGT